MRMREKSILRVVAQPLVPTILLYALYVQFHGDFGPGGGFQAGVIFAAGFILYSMIFGLAAVKKILPPRWVEFAIATGVLLYGGVGIAAILLGGNFLDYGAFDPHDPSHGQHLGILLVELGVGITVAGVMTMIYYSFAGRGQEEEQS
jgi:multicomponent Na+:H+ antiporter subunit B